MRTTNDFKEYVLEQLSILENITCRPMMGEYLLYYDSILFGGIYNNRLLIKRVETNEKFYLEEQIPYEGAKPMFMIEDLEDQEKLKEIVIETCSSLPKKSNQGKKLKKEYKK